VLDNGGIPMKVLVRTVTTVAAMLLLGVGMTSAGSLEGRWLLVEQTYGSGGSNLIKDEAPLRLEFFREGKRLAARAWFGDGSSGLLPWPSLLTGDGAEVRVEEIVIAPREDSVRARYRTEPAPGEETALWIVEEYRVDDDGKALTGTVTVSLSRAGEPGGSYVLHRRFEREP
jgi:hypothetical protein